MPIKRQDPCMRRLWTGELVERWELDGCGAGWPVMHEGNEGVVRIGHDRPLRACWAVDLQGGVSCTVAKFPVYRVRGTGYVRCGSIILLRGTWIDNFKFPFRKGCTFSGRFRGYPKRITWDMDR